MSEKLQEERVKGYTRGSVLSAALGAIAADHLDLYAHSK
jgi:hypothetical protein